ncbi:SDR family oxidoreductase [Amycolatopsis sp.]|uniref:SDR family oxidoreductase n=1 Tax=Amycolatopsis sp. TaxID=37632 RepID=UPI002C6E5605|nr:SDR family oxidoreductase [Amycolatopsis sp.]HVV11943.1 SDR family oxidoreductase [Amycolatopsis sp.]
MTVALVTGSSRGIGRAIAQRLAADGADLVVNYRTDRAAADEVVAGIEAKGGKAIAVQADVADPGQLRGLFDAAERFGPLDVLVSNVGVARFAPIAEASDEDFDLVFATNTRATLGVLREGAKRVRDGGRIISISSGAAVTLRVGGGVYGASKAASDVLVQTAAKELGPRGITVNSVRPGSTRTDGLESVMSAERLRQSAEATPLGRIGEPGDIADVVAFLASDDARWITGQILHAGGGLF